MSNDFRDFLRDHVVVAHVGDRKAYKPRPASEVTTEDLIATISADRDQLATFEARAEFEKRCRGWEKYAPAKPRAFVTDPNDGGRIYWHNFHETGWL